LASPGSQQAEQQREQAEQSAGGAAERAERSGAPEQAERSGAPEQAERSGAAEQADRGGAAEQADRAGAPEQADRAPAGPADEIGARVASFRARRGRKVSELARQVGVSPSLISQIERGQSRPSVSTLFALAEALEVPVDAFFRDSGEEADAAPDRPKLVEATPQGEDEPAAGHRYMVRKDERAAIDIEGGVRWERLTPTTLDNVDFMELVYAPKAESNPTLYRHPGTEMVLVIEGRMDIYVGFERHALGPGDSIHFPSSFPHRYVNPTDEVTRAVTVILHDEGGRPPSAPAPQRRS
jgi:transcriptional regulator with XRE-family HTH domain